MTEDEIGDASEYSHLPSGQRLYHLLLRMSDEQVVNSSRVGVPMHYPVLAELWSDVDELATLMLEEDPADASATDYREGWAALGAQYRDPRKENWTMRPDEARERSRVVKRFLLRAGPLSLRRKKGESSKDYWTQEALEYQ